MMFHDAIVRVRAGMVTDRWGNDVADWDNAFRLQIDQVAVLPTQQVEDATGNRVTVMTGWRLYSKTGVDIDLLPADRVEWNGISLEVVGDVARWPHPIRRGAVHHVEAQLQRRSG